MLIFLLNSNEMIFDLIDRVIDSVNDNIACMAFKL